MHGSLVRSPARDNHPFPHFCHLVLSPSSLPPLFLWHPTSLYFPTTPPLDYIFLWYLLPPILSYFCLSFVSQSPAPIPTIMPYAWLLPYSSGGTYVMYTVGSDVVLKCWDSMPYWVRGNQGGLQVHWEVHYLARLSWLDETWLKLMCCIYSDILKGWKVGGLLRQRDVERTNKGVIWYDFRPRTRYMNRESFIPRDRIRNQGTETVVDQRMGMMSYTMGKMSETINRGASDIVRCLRSLLRYLCWIYNIVSASLT